MGCQASTATLAASPSAPSAVSTDKGGESRKLKRGETFRYKTFHVTLVKDEGVSLGGILKPWAGRVIIVCIAKKGLIQEWNDQHPNNAIRPGDKIVSVNGVSASCMDDAVQEFWKVGTVECVIERDLSKEVEVESTDAHVFLQSYRPYVNDIRPCTMLDALHHCNAGDCAATECAICLGEYDDPNIRVVELPCGHVFHPLCAARWLSTNSKQCYCPLCKCWLGNVNKIAPHDPARAPEPKQDSSEHNVDSSSDTGTTVGSASFTDSSFASVEERVRWSL